MYRMSELLRINRKVFPASNLTILRDGVRPSQIFSEPPIGRNRRNKPLNTRLPLAGFQQIRKILLPETCSFLANEQARLAHA